MQKINKITKSSSICSAVVKVLPHVHVFRRSAPLWGHVVLYGDKIGRWF